MKRSIREWFEELRSAKKFGVDEKTPRLFASKRQVSLSSWTKNLTTTAATTIRTTMILNKYVLVMTKASSSKTKSARIFDIIWK